MATEAELLPVRKTLTEKYGVADNRIGFDPTSGYVTVDNQKILRPDTNNEGTTFAGQDVFNSAQGQLNSLNNANTLQQQAMNPQKTVSPVDQQFQSVLGQLQGRINAPQANPYASQIDSLISSLTQKVNNPAAVDRNSIYGSADYAAEQAQAQQQAQQATRAAQESLGASGFGRSTKLTDRAQAIQNDSNQYLETQVVPQLIAAEQGRQQQQLGNLFALLNPLQSQQSAYSADQRDANSDLLGLLGVYGQQQGRADTQEQNQFNRTLDLLTRSDNQANRAEDVAYRTGRDAIGDQQYADTTKYNHGRDEALDQRYTDETAYKKERDTAADQQLAEEKAYRATRDSEDDRRWAADYERAGKEFAAQQGYNWAQLNQRDKEFIADQAYKNKALERENDPNSLDNKYKQAQIDTLTSKVDKPDEAFIANRDAMVQQLRSGQLRPKDALKVIGEDAQIGYYTPDQADALRNMVDVLFPTKKTKTSDAPTAEDVNGAKSIIYGQNPYLTPGQR